MRELGFPVAARARIAAGRRELDLGLRWDFRRAAKGMVMVAGKSSDFSGGARAALRRWLWMENGSRSSKMVGEAAAAVQSGDLAVQVVSAVEGGVFGGSVRRRRGGCGGSFRRRRGGDGGDVEAEKRHIIGF
ncbi:hypothetical protein CASFOL_008941 [Castilleja foliolosa]|uniref:Uncharacterized protein n=1 Tax=Castilleja foliolosa TaxID=1961234 RepID=A0ABD3E0Q6_9LAMI